MSNVTKVGRIAGNKAVKRGGFTLIELLVVVLIIGILAAVALPQYQWAVRKSRATQALTAMTDLRQVIDRWVLEHGYPEERVDFLGPEATATLDINLGEPAAQGVENKIGDYNVAAACHDTGCWIWAGLGVDNYASDYHELYSNKNGGTGEWRTSCSVYSNEYSPVGLELCSKLGF